VFSTNSSRRATEHELHRGNVHVKTYTEQQYLGPADHHHSPPPPNPASTVMLMDALVENRTTRGAAQHVRGTAGSMPSSSCLGFFPFRLVLSLSLGMHAHLYLIDGSAAATTPPTAGEHKVDMEAASFTAHSIRHVQNAPLHGLVPCTD
jgi:hypothetical protein